jgi:hypothetical protein
MGKLLILALGITTFLYAEGGRPCSEVGGVLMTNINAIPIPDASNGTNFGPMFGDLAGSVAATILGQDSAGAYLVQHYFVTAAGDTIKLGGTGKFENATGQLEYFGLADFTNLTLVLRYRGQVCYGR